MFIHSNLTYNIFIASHPLPTFHHLLFTTIFTFAQHPKKIPASKKQNVNKFFACGISVLSRNSLLQDVFDDFEEIKALKVIKITSGALLSA